MVEGARLERVCAGNRTVGSNPTPSAIFALTRRRRSAGAALVPGRLAPEPFGLEFELGPVRPAIHARSPLSSHCA